MQVPEQVQAPVTRRDPGLFRINPVWLAVPAAKPERLQRISQAQPQEKASRDPARFPASQVRQPAGKAEPAEAKVAQLQQLPQEQEQEQVQAQAAQKALDRKHSMQQAILQFEYQAAAAQDAPDSMAAVEAARFRRSDPRDAAALADAMRQVTRTQIAEAAMQLVPDTVYLLRAAEGEGADPDAG